MRLLKSRKITYRRTQPALSVVEGSAPDESARITQAPLVLCCHPYAPTACSPAVVPSFAIVRTNENHFAGWFGFRLLDMARQVPAILLRRHSAHGTPGRSARLVGSCDCSRARGPRRIRTPLGN